jgi:hypothetical protein
MTMDTSVNGTDFPDVSEEADEHREQLRQSCYEQGLLAQSRLRGEYVTKDGRALITAAALVDPEVAPAYQFALSEPVTRRPRALVPVLLLARERLGAK